MAAAGDGQKGDRPRRELERLRRRAAAAGMAPEAAIITSAIERQSAP